MARLPIATRESVPQDQQEAFDEIVQRMGSVPIHGPESAMIFSPLAHRWLSGLNDYLRNHSSLPKKIQELSMVVTAREMDCQLIWNTHVPLALSAGVPDSLIDALRDRELTAMAPDEEAVVNLGREFFRTRKVSRDGFQQAVEQFGERGAVELVMIMGSYSLYSFVVIAFDTDLLPDRIGPSGEPLYPL